MQKRLIKTQRKFWRRFGAPINEKSAQLVVFTTRYADFGGERGIRTPGTSQYAGFQDRCNRPLCHLSLLAMQVMEGILPC